MTGHGAKFPRKREQAIIALLVQPSIKQAAQSVGISEVTLFRWLQEPDFQRAYREAKHRAVEQAISRLQQVSREAVDTLREVMIDTEKPPSTRVNAAKTILEMAIKADELEDLASRVEELEKHIKSGR